MATAEAAVGPLSMPPPPGARLKSRVGNASWFRVLSAMIVVLLIATTVYAIARIGNRAFTRSAFDALTRYRGLASTLENTVAVVALSSLAALVVGTGLAWVNERTDARMGAFTDVFPFLPFLMPPIAGAIGWVLLLAPAGGYLNSFIRYVLSHVDVHLTKGPIDVYTIYGLVIVYTIYLVPYVFLIMSAGIRNLDPQLEEQSRISGSGVLRTFIRVTIPGLTSSLVSSVLIVVWTGFGMFAIPQAIATPGKIPILTVETVNVISFTYPPNFGLGVMLSVVTMAFVGVAWYFQARVRGRSHNLIGGGRSARTTMRLELGRWRLPMRIGLVGFIILVTVFPVLALALVALSGYWSATVPWGHLSLGAFTSTLLHNHGTVLAIEDSFKIGLYTATIGAVVATVTSVLLARRRSWVARLLDGGVKLPAVLSPLVIAIGFILGFAGKPFALGGTVVILVIAYVVVTVPQGTISTDAAVGQIGPELIEASQLTGAGAWRTFRRVLVPLMLSAIAIAWALIFVRVLGDLEVSAMLAGTNNPTIGYQTMMLYNQGSYSDVAALTLLVFVSSALVVSVALLGARRLSKWSLAAPATAAVADV